MRFSFRELPEATGGLRTPRPVVDVWLEGFGSGPFTCLVDTGALRTRFSREAAKVVGIEPDDSQTEPFVVGGTRVSGAPARVTLRIEGDGKRHDWDATVWFCDPWPFGFQLLGLDGFLRHYRVTIAAYEEWLECEPYGVS